jgi:hypothetical protein
MKQALKSLAIVAISYGALWLLDFARRHPRDAVVDVVMTVISTVLMAALYCGIGDAVVRGWRYLRRQRTLD